MYKHILLSMDAGRSNSETMLPFVGVRFMVICNFGREVHSSDWQIPKNLFFSLIYEIYI